MAGCAPSPAARADLEEIRDCTARHWDDAQAERCTRDTQAACKAPGDGATRGRPADDVRAEHLKLSVGSHVMFYRVRFDAVEIIRILHQRLDAVLHV